MNFFKKIYCRLYQFCFKIILPFLPYKKPGILTTEKDIINVLNKHKITSVLIVTGKRVAKTRILTKLTEELNLANIKYIVYDDTVPNPTISNVEEAYKVYMDNSLQGIIGLGGGSNMDLSKIVGAKVARPKKTVEKMKGILKINKKIPLLIAIPTTAGSGSEVTITAVISNQETHHKYTINDFCLIPKYAVLDYNNTIELPPIITATTGMDALTHAIEAYLNNTRTKETKKMSLEATKLIVENLKECYINPTNIEARKNMLYASYYAGISFTKAYVGYVHAVAHTLGGQYNIAHGLANAVILPIMLEEYGFSIYKKMKQLAVYSNIANIEDEPKKACEKLISWIYKINEELNIPKNIKEIKEEDIDTLVNYAYKEANPLYPVPKLMGKQQLKSIYLKVKGE